MLIRHGILRCALLAGPALSSAGAQRGREPLDADLRENLAVTSCRAATDARWSRRTLTAAERTELLGRPNFAPVPEVQEPLSLLDHFEPGLLAWWTASVPATAMIVAVQPEEGQPFSATHALCALQRDVVVGAFALQTATPAGEPIRSSALHQLARSMQTVSIGRMAALLDRGLRPRIAEQVADTLARLEQLLGVRDETPVLAVLFANQKRFTARFMIGWSDGVFSDWTLSEPGIGAVVFAASRENGISSHELVHVVLKSVHADVAARGSTIPYVAEEALARTIGGSRGKSYRELIGPITLVEARRVIAAEMQDAALAAVRFDARRPYEPAVDALGAAYRVAMSACRIFPADLLDARAVTTLSAAVNRLAIHLRVTPDAAVDSMAKRLAAPSNVFERRFRRPVTQLLDCTPYLVPLERAHPP